jgi:hypothetical protein
MMGPISIALALVRMGLMGNEIQYGDQQQHERIAADLGERFAALQDAEARANNAIQRLEALTYDLPACKDLAPSAQLSTDGWTEEAVGFSATHPEFDAAYENRANDPLAWRQQRAIFAKHVEAKYAARYTYDETATADREMVRQSVQSMSGKRPEAPAPDYSSMTDREFEKETEKYGFRPW